jgi:hypothetical protein
MAPAAVAVAAPGGASRRAVFPKGPPRRLRETDRKWIVASGSSFRHARAPIFILFFFVLIFSGAGGWIPRPQMPFADFKTASELENVGGKNEE